MSFCIRSIETRVVDHPLIEERMIISPVGRHDMSRFLAVKVVIDDGASGYGEAATTALWSGETAEIAQCAVEKLFAPAAVKASFDHPVQVAALLDKTAYGLPFSKSAIETAVWDAWARSQNQSAWQLFGDRTPIDEIPTRASVGCYDVQQTVRIAAEFFETGIRTLKFKVGAPGFDDVSRLRAVREKLGEEAAFTVDANGGYKSVKQAVEAIEALLPCGLLLVEQPTPRERISLLAEVKKRVPVPVMADECVFNMQELQEALDFDACDFVGLYPGKNGGVSRTIEMAKLAQRYGKACTIGSNLETDLGQAAMAAVASALSAFPVDQLACDLPASLFYPCSSVKEPLRLEAGKVRVPRGAGFGVTPVVFR